MGLKIFNIINCLFNEFLENKRICFRFIIVIKLRNIFLNFIIIFEFL